ncbi:MAG: hypothetical protein WDO24_13750 [Pseudomonadota bacterium]
MVEYPRALRIAHHVVYFHQGDAHAYVAGKIAEAVQTGKDSQAAEWRKVGHFVDRLLGEAPPAAPPPQARHRRASPRVRRVRPPGAY